ncbi:hypothetical protein XELAEV_18022591mg [Xenopus laevis]|uniref:Uncharacterized protein n=1 Tax=Xenopus laevis TaxID=8355 RepID=A0A974HNA7_XENLA|nr:hypothetical protein XELAEV_18022591mg [Xenopus laevis]
MVRKSFQLEAVEKTLAGLRLFKPKMSFESGYMQMNNGWQKSPQLYRVCDHGRITLCNRLQTFKSREQVQE